uniref:Major sperm protein n=1 Tax=Panagrolaimus sp. JU765 TaxID=591449 RepID=A0AC34R256_9BILA
MDETQVVPPFLARVQPGTPAKNSPSQRSPKFLQLDVNNVKFQLGDVPALKKTITLTNTSGLRIAWRIRANAPTRYVVNPACGFLTSNEAQTLMIELMEPAKYSDRHKFIVQAIEAKDDEKDRRKIWEDSRATQLDKIQCVRVLTSGLTMTPLSTTSIDASSSASGTSTGTTASSTTSGTSLASTDSIGSSASTTESTGSLSSTGSTISDWGDKITELTNQAKTLLESKNKNSKQMVELVNQVKRVEVELDRSAQEYATLNSRFSELTNDIAQLEKKSKQLDEDLKALNKEKEFIMK